MDAVAIEGRVNTEAGTPVAGAVVLASDEGILLGTTVTDPAGQFRLDGLPAAGRIALRATSTDSGAALVVVDLADAAPVALVVSLQGCLGYLDLPDPALLVSTGFLDGWGLPPLVASCPDCPVYRWFWDRPGATPAVLRVDYTPDGVRSTVRTLVDGTWTDHVTPLSPRRSARLDRAIGRSGYWQLEHHDTTRGCFSAGSEWTVEAIASPGYRAVYRWSPNGTPLASLGREWLRAARVRVKRRDFQ